MKNYYDIGDDVLVLSGFSTMSGPGRIVKIEKDENNEDMEYDIELFDDDEGSMPFWPGEIQPLR